MQILENRLAVSIHTVNHCTEYMYVNLEEINRIVAWYAKHVDWVKPTKVRMMQEGRRQLGCIYTSEQKMHINGEKGATVGTVIHELAHYKAHGHGFDFKKAQAELLEWWDNFSEEVVSMHPSAVTGDLENALDYFMDIAEEGKKITKFQVINELQAQNIHTPENVTLLLELLALNNIRVL